jgi:hypothetical protein
MGAIRVNPTTGNYIGEYDDEFIQEGWTMVTQPLPEPNPFTISQYNFETLQWQEGGDIEAINAQKREELLKELTAECVKLTDRSIISSVAKEEKDLKYLDGQIDRYLDKYKVAKHYIDNSGAILNQTWYDQIVSEMNTSIVETDAPLTIPVFMGLIVQYYEAGQERKQKFNAAIELFRCKTKDLIMTNKFERARTSLDLAKAVPPSVSMELLNILLTQLDAI